MLNAITYEVNHSRILTERGDYGIFEMMGDIGGLYGMFFDFFGPFVVMLLVGDEAHMAIAF